jgi:hypothetical protein
VTAGGVHLQQLTAIGDSQIVSNVSDGGGGGVYVNDTSALYDADVTDCTIEGNVAATDGGGALVQGMGFRIRSSDWGAGAADNAPDDLVFYASVDSDPVTYADLETDVDLERDVLEAACE